MIKTSYFKYQVAGLISLLVITILSLPACKTLSGPNNAAVIQAAVDVAVGTTVGSDAARAVQISAIAQSIIAADSGGSVSLSSLQSALDASITAANLNPADKQAMELLTTTLYGIVGQDISPASGVLPPSTITTINQVLQDVVLACATYGTQIRLMRGHQL